MIRFLVLLIKKIDQELEESQFEYVRWELVMLLDKNALK